MERGEGEREGKRVLWHGIGEFGRIPSAMLISYLISSKIEFDSTSILKLAVIEYKQ